jgi:CheY-like chemotaxis protein
LVWDSGKLYKALGANAHCADQVMHHARPQVSYKYRHSVAFHREALSLQDHPLIIAATVAAEAVLHRVGVITIRLVMADIHLTVCLQGYEGYELYERWHRRYPQLAFLLMSGSPIGQDLPEVRTGGVRCLAKPFAIQDLLQAVQEETHEGAGLFDA